MKLEARPLGKTGIIVSPSFQAGTTEPYGEDGLHIIPPKGPCFHYTGDDTHCYFSCDPSRGHKRVNPRLMGTSTPVKTLDIDPTYLLRWAGRNTAFLALRGEDERLRQARDPRALWAVLKELRLTHEEENAEAMVRGTNVHAVLEALLTGKPLPEIAEGEEGYVDAVKGWLADAQPEPLNVEQFVLSETHGYAGRFDLRYRDRNGAVTLLDMKTSAYVSVGFHVQLAGYECAAKECGVGASDHRLILQVKPTGEWREIRALGTEGHFLDALAAYKTAKQLKAQIDKQYRSRQESLDV